MLAAILASPILLKLGGLLLLLFSVLGAYFGVKRKGINEERARNQAQREKEVAAVQTAVNQATAQDAKIDQLTSKKINEAEQSTKPVDRVDGDNFDLFRGLRR